MRMKQVAGGLVLAVALGNLWAQAPHAAKLTGIFYWNNRAHALLEWRSEKGASRKPILRDGESVDGFKVQAVDEKMGTVEVLERRENTKVTLGLGLTPEEQLPQRTFYFRSADLEQVFEVYQEVSGRTVVRPGNLVLSKIGFKSNANISPEKAVAALDKEIAGARIKMKPIGTKFVLALREGDDRLVQSLAEPPLIKPDDERFPPGLIKFTETDVAQVLEVYSELTGQPRTKRDLPRSAKISLRSQTPLTRAEAAWLIEAALLLNGFPVRPRAIN